jgi:hypothetical protein
MEFGELGWYNECAVFSEALSLLLTLSSYKIKNVRSCASASQYAFIVWCLSTLLPLPLKSYPYVCLIDIWWSGGVTQFIRNFGTRWKYVVNSPWLTILLVEYRLGGPQRQSGCTGVENDLLCRE